jgi:hypothetical protein
MAQPAPDVDQLIQAVIAAANAAALAAGPPAPPVNVPPAQPAPFALLPGAAYNAPLDFSKSNELKIFRSATLGMTDKLVLKEQQLRVFLSNLKEHIRIYAWDAIVTIPDDAAVNRNLITNYGQVTIANVRAHAITYITTPTRNAQNSMMLYLYLLNSLTEESKMTMITVHDQYHELGLPSGPMFLKSIIGRASIDSKAKILSLRQEVSQLYVKMLDLKDNVREFNQHVAEVKAALLGRGETVNELVMHLFKAYEQVPDQQFVRYIEAIRDRYDADVEDQTDEGLMMLAVNKYDLITQRNAMPSDNIERVVALQTNVTTTSTTRNRARNNRPEDAWKKVPPKGGEPKSKLVNGQVYNFCPDHKAWCIHTIAQCTLAKARKAAQDAIAKQGKLEDTDDDAADKLVINRAYHVILHEGDSEDD